MPSSGDDDLVTKVGGLLGSLFGSGSSARKPSRPAVKRAAPGQPLDDGDGGGEAAAEAAEAAAAGEAKGAEAAKDRSPLGMLGDLADGVTEMVQRQTAATGLLRYRTRPGHDQVATPGEILELSVALDVVLHKVASSVRFFVDGEALEPVEITSDGEARVLHTVEGLGCVEARYEVLDSGGNVLDGAPGQECLLQVAGERPVAAVDAQLVLAGPAERLQPLRDLVARGWELVYVDQRVRDRTRDIHRAVRRFDLPAGAALVHPEKEEEVKTLGVDFSEVFGMTTLRRMRARGVPLALFVGSVRWVERAARGPHPELHVMDLEELAEDLAAGAHGVDDCAALASRIVAARESADPYAWRLDRMTRTRAVDGNDCAVEFDNQQAREAMYAAVDGACRSVHIQFYMFKDCRFTQHLAARLVGAGRRGVAVRLMVDAVYSGQHVLGKTMPLLEHLSRQPGVDVLAIDPIHETGQVETIQLKRRDHRKLLIVDGELAWVSGRNAGDEYYTSYREAAVLDWTPADEIPWLDAHIRLRGPLVREVQDSFLHTWKTNGGEEPSEGAEVYLPSYPPVGDLRARLVLHHGVEDANSLGAYEAMMDAARSHIMVINDFPVVPSLGSALRRAVARGVRVRVLTGNGNARRADGVQFEGSRARELFEYMTKHRFEELMRCGVEVYEYVAPRGPNIACTGELVRPYVHAKMVSVDGRVASVGSANLDPTACYWEREAIVVVEDPGFVASLEATIATMFDRAYRIDLESDYWKSEATKRAVVSTLWPESVL